MSWTQMCIDLCCINIWPGNEDGLQFVKRVMSPLQPSLHHNFPESLFLFGCVRQTVEDKVCQWRILFSFCVIELLLTHMTKAVRLLPAQSIKLKRRKHDTGMKYNSGRVNKINSVNSHRTTCLPSVGLKMLMTEAFSIMEVGLHQQVLWIQMAAQHQRTEIIKLEIFFGIMIILCVRPPWGDKLPYFQLHCEPVGRPWLNLLVYWQRMKLMVWLTPDVVFCHRWLDLHGDGWECADGDGEDEAHWQSRHPDLTMKHRINIINIFV